jgi:hypothetical protein
MVSPSIWYKTFVAYYDVDVGSHKPRPRRYTGPPMDLANMRANGVRALAVSCHDCLHNADVNVDAYPGHLAVQSFVRRMRCSKCGGHNISLMPAWHTKRHYVARECDRK